MAKRLKPQTVLSGVIGYSQFGPAGTVEFTMDAELFEKRDIEVLKADLDCLVRAHCPAASVIHWRVTGRFQEGDEFYSRNRAL